MSNPADMTNDELMAFAKGDHLTTYTVFAVYEEDYQPYATTVEAEDPLAAMAVAQETADEDNGAHVPLAGMQVVRGNVEVLA